MANIILPEASQIETFLDGNSFIVEKDGDLFRLTLEKLKENLDIGENIDFDTVELIGPTDIDAICGSTIIDATSGEVTF